MEETTVDFIIRYPDGKFYSKKPIANEWRYNHLNAYSFHTRADAERFVSKDSIVIKRKSILEW